MKNTQLFVLWLAGILVSGILFSTGYKLLDHAARSAETLETGYPFTVLAGTAWAYILPIVIIGILLAVSLKGKK